MGNTLIVNPEPREVPLRGNARAARRAPAAREGFSTEVQRVLEAFAAGKLAERARTAGFEDREWESLTALNRLLERAASAEQEERMAAELSRLAAATREGKLSERAQSENFSGRHQQMLTEVNQMLDSIVTPLPTALACVAQAGRGEIPAKIAESWPGDMEELRLSLNLLAEGMGSICEVNHVLKQSAVNDYTCKVERHYQGIFGEMAEAINGNLARIRQIEAIVQHVASGDFTKDMEILRRAGKRSENDVFVPGFLGMMEAIHLLVADANMLAKGAVEGTVHVRADAAKHQGEYRKVAEGMNQMLDAIVTPMHAALACVVQAGRGEIPAKITESWPGDMELPRLALNSLAESMTGVAEVNQVLKQFALNDHTRKVEGHYQGIFGEMAEAANDTRSRIMHIAEIAQNIARGDFAKDLEELRRVGKRSENDALRPAFLAMMEAIRSLVDDANMLATDAVQGKLDTRADATRHQGDFRRIVEGVNATLDAVVGPLQEVQLALGKLSEGDFTVVIVKEYAGEFNQLKNAVNTMATQVRGALVKIGKETATLASSSEQLGRVSQQMSASAEETAAQANVVSAASEQVSTNIQTVATGADEMGASIKEIAKNTADATKIANSAVVLSKSTNETVRKLGASSAEIGQVIKVITSIAQQTNLLALNATIEAARAGEAGKGFAVVANEVKELAKQTAKATEDISQKIQAIQQDAGGAVTAIGQITEVIGQINDIQNTIASAIEEQSATTNEISRNLSEAAKGGADITLNIASVAQVAKTTTEAAGQTQSSAKSLEDLAAQVRELVCQFKYEEARGAVGRS